MCNQTSEINARRPAFAYHRIPVFLGIIMLGVASSGQAANAKLAARQLLANSIEQYGPQYEKVEVAIAAFKRKDFDTARTTLRDVKAKHPQLPPADVMMALMYLSVGNRAEAETSLDHAVISDASDPEAFVLVADLALRDRKHTFADLGYQRAQALLEQYVTNPKRKRHLTARVHAGLASVSEARKLYDMAAQHLEAWIALDEKNPIPRGSLGRVLFHLKKYTDARAAFTKLNELAKDSTPVEIAMGRLYSDAGNRELAKKNMEMAVVNHAKDPRARLTVAEWALNTGLTEMAEENINAALELDKDSIGGKVLKARLARQEGNEQQAETVLNEAVLQSPNDFVSTNELARVLAASQDNTKRRAALQYARRNFQTYRHRRSTPVAREAVLTYAWVLLHNDRAKEAAAALITLPNGSTLSNENVYYSAKIYAEVGQRNVAISALQAALSRDTPFPGRADAEKLLKSLSGEEAVD